MIQLTLSQNTTISVQNDTSAVSILADIAKAANCDANAIAGISVNNEVCPLHFPFTYTANVEPVLINSTEGASIYRRTLCFVLATAAHKLFPHKRLIVGHSLGHGYYYTFESDEDDGTDTLAKNIEALKSAMQKYQQDAMPIYQKTVSYQEAITLFETLHLEETRKQLCFMCPPHLTINCLDGFSDLYYAPLLDNSAKISTFDITPYGKGFLLRFPPSDNPTKLEPLPNSPKLFSVYQRYKEWGKLVGVTSAASLNEHVINRTYKDFINLTETLQTKRFAEAADMIHDKKDVRMVLIAGPSSSGKTTSSKKLAQQLRVIGYTPHIISLDDYYVGREDTPRDENGDFDYECLEALDVKLINENFLKLFEGKTIDMPSYDFVAGARKYTGKTLCLNKNDILIVEGIHGLNERLTSAIDSSLKFKIYVSALTQLNLDDLTRISTSDNRLIRRIVRDSQFRGKSAAATISMWPSVRRGERLHIFPFQNNADVMINTALDYELSVLRTYAMPLLRCVSPLQKEYAEAHRLLTFLNNFAPIPSSAVPGQSLIREFIGGSEFKY